MKNTLLLMTLCFCLPVQAADYMNVHRELVTAYKIRDYAAMQAAAESALELRPDYPPMLYKLAIAHSLQGETFETMTLLNRLADMRVRMPLENDEDLRSLHDNENWHALVARYQLLNKPVGTAERAYEFAQKDFIPEGIAIDKNGVLYLGGIRHGNIVRLQDGKVHALAAPENNKWWSVFGMRLGVRGDLWFASSGIPEYAGSEAASGQAGIIRIDAATGKLLEQFILPDDGNAHVFGELLLTRNGVYVSDSLGGILRLRNGKFETLLEAGRLISPQGMVLLDNGRLMIADYRGGLFTLEPETGTLNRVSAPGNVSLYGIDGLYRYGDDLIAAQNGITPHRVTRLKFDAHNNAVTSAEILLMNHPDFDEPTLGAVHDGAFYVIANSHWNRFDRDGKLAESETLNGPIVLRIALE